MSSKTNNMKIATELSLIEQISAIYAAKGWNAVRGFLKRNKIPHIFSVVDFGLDNKTNRSAKGEWIADADKNQFRAHLYSIATKSRRTGYSYNKLRGQVVQIETEF